MQTNDVVNQSKLSEIARVLGGAELEEYNTLLAYKIQLEDIVRKVIALPIKVKESEPVTVGDMPGEKIASLKPRPVPRITSKRTVSVKKSFDNMPEVEKIYWIIDTLESRNGKTFSSKNWKNRLKEHFGYYDEALSRSGKANLARARGKFKPHFISRIRKAFTDEEAANKLVERYAKIP